MRTSRDLTIVEVRRMLRAMDAFEALVPVSDAYGHLPIAEAFDWSDVSAQLGTGEWYLVAFRSLRRGGCDEDRLRELDDLAHQEAASSPGFVCYYKGPLSSDRSCLSFCMWTSRGEARAAAGRPDHVTAVSVLDEMYESYRLEFVRVTGELGRPLRFEPYDTPVIDPEAPKAA